MADYLDRIVARYSPKSDRGPESSGTTSAEVSRPRRDLEDELSDALDDLAELAASAPPKVLNAMKIKPPCEPCAKAMAEARRNGEWVH